MLSYERICSRLFDQPHLYDPRKAETVLKMLGPRLTGFQIDVVNGPGGVDHTAFGNGRPSAGVIGDRLGRAYDARGLKTYDMVDGVAIIPIEGTLVHKGSWIGNSSGETSYEGLRAQATRATRDPQVRAAVLEIDSFGGMVNGAFEAATAIRALSKAKPTLAILTDYAYSAGYLLASQARQIVIPPFGGAGSIGVVMMHADFSGSLEQDGIKVTFIYSGSHKVDGNPYQPLPEAVRLRWQGEIDAMRDAFATTVGAGRGRRFTKAAALKTEAETYTASEAERLGLVDAVGDPEEAFRAFVKAVNRSI